MIKARLEMMGRIVVESEENSGDQDVFPMALLISFANAEDIRQAIKDGAVTFTFITE